MIIGYRPVTYIDIRYQTGWQLVQKLSIPYDMMTRTKLQIKYKVYQPNLSLKTKVKVNCAGKAPRSFYSPE